MKLSVESNLALHLIIFFENHVSDHDTEFVCSSFGHLILILHVWMNWEF
jgi:hypothetical protein